MVDYGNTRNNPACTKNVSVFKLLRLDTVWRRKKKMTVARCEL